MLNVIDYTPQVPSEDMACRKIWVLTRVTYNYQPVRTLSLTSSLLKVTYFIIQFDKVVHIHRNSMQNYLSVSIQSDVGHRIKTYQTKSQGLKFNC